MQIWISRSANECLRRFSKEFNALPRRRMPWIDQCGSQTGMAGVVKMWSGPWRRCTTWILDNTFTVGHWVWTRTKTNLSACLKGSISRKIEAGFGFFNRAQRVSALIFFPKRFTYWYIVVRGWIFDALARWTRLATQAYWLYRSPVVHATKIDSRALPRAGHHSFCASSLHYLLFSLNPWLWW